MFITSTWPQSVHGAAGAASTGGFASPAEQKAAQKAGEQALKRAQDAGQGTENLGKAADIAGKAVDAAADTAGAAAQTAGAAAVTGAAATVGTAAAAGAAVTAGALAAKGAASLIDSAKKIGDKAIGGALPDKKQKTLYEGMTLPSTVAVLPATGNGEEADLKEIRISMANHLGYKNYQDLEIAEIEAKLYMATQAQGKKWTDFSPQKLGELLNTDGLLYTEVLGIEKVYVGVYASLTVRVNTKLVDAKSGDVIWVKEDASSKKAGGVPTSIFSAISTAVSSSLVLKESVKIMLIDQLCRRIVKEMPEPESLGAIKPPPIFSVITNGLDGPFKANDEILVSMKGEKSFHSYFIIGKGREAVPMTEIEPETYMGKYIVKEGDNWSNELLYVYLANTGQRVESRYMAPHPVTVDTIPPKSVENASSTITKEGVVLTWQKPQDEDDLVDFTIARASVDSQKFNMIGTTPVPEFVDKNIVFGKKYYYRIYSRDKAKNLSKEQEIIQMAVKPGPTNISGELSSQSFYNVASPYIFSGAVVLPASARLNIDRGVIMEFNSGSSLKILGKVNASGTPEANISIKGNKYKIEFVDAGEAAGVLTGVYFSGGDTIRITNSSIKLENSIIEDFNTGLVLEKGGKAVISRTIIRKNKTGLASTDSQLTLDNVEFAENEKGLVINNGSKLAAGNLKSTRNGIFVESKVPVSLAMVEFDEQSWPEIINKFTGQISVQSIQPAGLSLDKMKEGLLDKLLNQLGEELAKPDFISAKKSADSLEASSPNTFKSMSDVMAYIYHFGGDQARAAEILKQGEIKNRALLAKVLVSPEAAKNQTAVSVKFISSRVPMVSSDADAARNNLKKANTSAVKEFVEARCGADVNAREKRDFINKIPDKLDSYVLASIPVFQKGQAGVYGGTYMVFLNAEVIAGELAPLQVTAIKDSDVKLGVVDCTGLDIFESVVKNSLNKINFKYEYLGSGSCEPASYYKIANERKINILLMIGADFNVSSSRLGSVLKMISATLRINAFDADSKHSVLNLSKNVQVSHVNEDAGKKFALKEAFNGIQSSFEKELIQIEGRCSLQSKKN